MMSQFLTNEKSGSNFGGSGPWSIEGQKTSLFGLYWAYYHPPSPWRVRTQWMTLRLLGGVLIYRPMNYHDIYYISLSINVLQEL